MSGIVYPIKVFSSKFSSVMQHVMMLGILPLLFQSVWAAHNNVSQISPNQKRKLQTTNSRFCWRCWNMYGLTPSSYTPRVIVVYPLLSPTPIRYKKHFLSNGWSRCTHVKISRSRSRTVPNIVAFKSFLILSNV